MGKKQKSRKGRKERTYRSDILGMPALRMGAGPASKGNLAEEERPAVAREPAFSVEIILHLIERIKSI